ncbi:MAG: outer membrane protein assembly factor BamA, partial [Deferrisomatales bacterium]|nr:outer membrane protein assembly factor BamA [Deferrisomatales bacterium]
MRKVLCLALGLLLAAEAAAERVLTEVKVRGNLRVEEGLVLQRVSSRPGEPYDAGRVREDLASIYALGYFEDIVVELGDDGVLTFVLLERPALREWKTEGVDNLDKEDVENAVSLRRREILDDARVEEGARALRDLYREKGYYLAEVRGEIQPVDDGRNHVDVVYRVSEGSRVRIKDVDLLGVSEEQHRPLRKAMGTRAAGWWSWLSRSGTFTDTDLERDREVIRSHYLNRGFVDVEVREPLVALTPDRRWLRIDIPVSEGEPHTIGRVTFSGDLDFPEETLRKAAGLTEGDTFRSDDFRKAHQGLTDLYADIGYAFVDVDPMTQVDPEARTLDLDFAIRKGDLVYLGRIEVRGNTKSRDRVVRREARLAEGDLYNGTAIQRTRRRIENLGFFEKVNLTTHRRPGTNLLDVDIEVEEKATGAFTVGAGYSSVDRIVGMASVSQRNFLGLAYQLAAQASFGTTRESYSLTFNNPRVFDSEVYAGIDLYKSRREYTDYTKDALGGALKLGTALSEEWRIRGIYRLEEAEVKNVSPNASRFLRDQQGTTVTSSLTSLLTYDSRDNPWEPRRGVNAEGSVEWAGGPLGGDAAFLKYGLDASRYVPLWLRHVLTLHGRVGYIHALQGRTIPVYERYYLGGISSLRGFDSRSVGPVDSETGDVIGGDKELLVNFEYLFPLIEEAKLRGVVFFDAGNAWEEGQGYLDTPLRRSAGFGVRWFSPLGPLRLEWGYVLDRKSGEDASNWEFSIGG